MDSDTLTQLGRKRNHFPDLVSYIRQTWNLSAETSQHLICSFPANSDEQGKLFLSSHPWKIKSKNIFLDIFLHYIGYSELFELWKRSCLSKTMINLIQLCLFSLKYYKFWKMLFGSQIKKYGSVLHSIKIDLVVFEIFFKRLF